MTGRVRAMFYKVLGFAVWRVFRGYLHHRFPLARRKLAIAGVAAVVVAGVGTAVAAQRRPDSG
jgi:hypothetical protein